MSVQLTCEFVGLAMPTNWKLKVLIKFVDLVQKII